MKIEQHMKGWYQSNLDVVFLFQGMSLEKHKVLCACQGIVGGQMLKKRRIPATNC